MAETGSTGTIPTDTLLKWLMREPGKVHGDLMASLDKLIMIAIDANAEERV